MTWLTTNHVQQLRLVSLCPSSPACAPGLGSGSQVPALSAGVHSPCWGEDKIPCPLVCQILLSLCSSKSNIQWTFHPQTFPLCKANFALPSHKFTFSRYSGLFWSFFFYFYISPLLSQLYLCSKVETFFSAPLAQAYPTFAFSSESSYSLN